MFDPNQQSFSYPLAGNSAETGSTPSPTPSPNLAESQTSSETESSGVQPPQVSSIENSPQPSPSGRQQPQILSVSQPAAFAAPSNPSPSPTPTPVSPARDSSSTVNERSAQVISIQPHLKPSWPEANTPPRNETPVPVRPEIPSQSAPGSSETANVEDDGSGPEIFRIDEQTATVATPTDAPSADAPSAAVPTPPTPETPAIKVVASLLKTSHLLRAFLADHFAEFGLSDIRYTVMRRIDQSGDQGCSQAELARELNQSESSISTLIDRMRNDGLIYRLRSQNDRRKRVLLLSDEGRLRFVRARACHGEKMGQLLSGLNEDQVGTLQTSLNVLTDELAETKQTETVRAAA